MFWGVNPTFFRALGVHGQHQTAPTFTTCLGVPCILAAASSVQNCGKGGTRMRSKATWRQRGLGEWFTNAGG